MDYNAFSGYELGSFLGALFGIILIFFIFLLFLLIILYIFQGIGLSKIAKNFKVENPWMAWIPFANVYLLGKLAIDDNIGIALAVLMVLSSLTSKIPFLGLASLGFVILSFIAAHKLYDKLSDKAVVMTVFSVLSMGLLMPIFIFAIRNNKIRIVKE